ncbi:MAG: TRAM domain-containing protein [Candidatus Nanoarchaeia archaeon]|jgi:predicted RNA-binding protein with TRAM domain|nr:TRAM domain-containing protein [Candidatus Nanoarchaeia archaeon]
MTNERTNNSQTVPVTVGEVIKAKVLSVGERGDGIVRTKGFVIFVPNVKQGDFIKLKITKLSSKVGFGECIEKLESLPFEGRKIPTPEELKQRTKGPKEDVSHLLTTEGDSEEF